MLEAVMKMLRGVGNNGGLTLKAGKAVSWKTGYQVADYGIETRELAAAAQKIVELGGTAGVWFSNGVWYIDHSFRVKTKRDALVIGRAHNQISILKWSTMELIYC